MADVPSDGNIAVRWVNAVANILAPTAAEANGGLVLEMTMTPEGLMAFRPTTNRIPNRKLGSTYRTTDVGSVSYGESALQFYKQQPSDIIYDTLTYRTTGVVIVRKSLARATAFASGQKVQVYPSKCGEVAHLDPEEDTEERYEIPINFYEQPELRATIA